MNQSSIKPGSSARSSPASAASQGSGEDARAPEEARYFGWERFGPEQRFSAKDQSLAAADIPGNAERAKLFLGVRRQGKLPP